MELKLLRACFPESTVGQLFYNNQLLCVYFGLNKKHGWTPVANLPDGRYSLKKPAKGNEEWSLQITLPESRKPLLMDLSNLVQEELNGYGNAPLYLSLGNGRQQISQPAKQNIGKVIAAVNSGDKVFINICSQYMS